MFPLRLSLLLSPVAFSVSVAECNSTPISIPIQDVQVLPGIERSYMTGIRAHIGFPSQDILLLPWAELNNTWIYDYEPDCDPNIIWNDRICQVRRGNYFYENASSTFDKKINMVDAGGATQEESSTDITDFPIGIPRSRWDHGYTTLHALGLGSNSTILNYLVGRGQIASRVWSIFLDRMWTSNWLDGYVVLGDYDSNLILGENFTDQLNYDNDEGCFTGMKVTVTNILLNKRNGVDVSITPTEFYLACCNVPQRQMLIEGPPVIRENFDKETEMNVSGSSSGLHWSAAQYLANEVYDGDLTIRVSSGLSVRIPNDQFLVPYVEIARDGTRASNDSLMDLLVNSTGGNRTATLGRYFLTAAYLMVDYDADTFTLWQANPSTGPLSLVPVAQRESTDPSCINSSNGGSDSDTTTSNSPIPEMDGSNLHSEGRRVSRFQQVPHTAGRSVHELDPYGRAS